MLVLYTARCIYLLKILCRQLQGLVPILRCTLECENTWNKIIPHFPSIDSALQGCQFLDSVTIVHPLAMQLGKILPTLLQRVQYITQWTPNYKLTNFFFGKNLAHTFSSSVFKLIMLLNAYKIQTIFTMHIHNK